MAGSSRQLKPIQPGELRHSGTIERPVKQLVHGVSSTIYETFATIRFSIEDFRGNEVFNGQTLESSLTVYVVCRYLPGVDSTMRVKRIIDGSISPPTVEYLAIQSIAGDPTRLRALQLACTKKDAAGFLMGQPST